MGIVLVEPLNRIELAGVPIGFWMAQQGSIYVFVVLVFLNAWLAGWPTATTPARDRALLHYAQRHRGALEHGGALLFIALVAAGERVG